jgi:DNA-binding NarL/FixJ family response regulator
VRSPQPGDPSPAHPSIAAIVVGGDSPTQHRVARLLAEAGFGVGRPGRTPAPGLALLLLSTDTEAERVGRLRTVRQAHPDTPILAVMPDDAPGSSLRRVLLAGATGIVLDNDIDRTLVPTASATLAGQLTVPTVLGRQIAPRPLSHREKQILSLVVQGRTNREIAGKLFLAESTVKTHLSSAFRKLDARSRAEAVTRVMNPENGYGAGTLEVGSDSLVAIG